MSNSFHDRIDRFFPVTFVASTSPSDTEVTRCNTLDQFSDALYKEVNYWPEEERDVIRTVLIDRFNKATAGSIKVGVSNAQFALAECTFTYQF